MSVTQSFPEAGNMGRVLPEYLSSWTTRKVAAEGVRVLPGTSVTSADRRGDQVELTLSDGSQVRHSRAEGRGHTWQGSTVPCSGSDHVLSLAVLYPVLALTVCSPWQYCTLFWL